MKSNVPNYWGIIYKAAAFLIILFLIIASVIGIFSSSMGTGYFVYLFGVSCASIISLALFKKTLVFFYSKKGPNLP